LLTIKKLYAITQSGRRRPNIIPTLSFISILLNESSDGLFTSVEYAVNAIIAYIHIIFTHKHIPTYIHTYIRT
jgi:hypothetical protein